MHPYAQPLVYALQAAANPADAGPMERYMKNRFEFFGIKTTPRREILKQFVRNHGLPPIAELEDVIEALWGQPHRECHYCAVELLERMRKQLGPQHLPLLEELVVTNSWWDTVDVIASHLVGFLFKQHPQFVPGYTEGG